MTWALIAAAGITQVVIHGEIITWPVAPSQAFPEHKAGLCHSGVLQAGTHGTIVPRELVF